MGRAEPGPRPIADARIKRDPDHSHVDVGHLVEPRQSGERRRAGKTRHQAGVDRTHAPVRDDARYGLGHGSSSKRRDWWIERKAR